MCSWIVIKVLAVRLILVASAGRRWVSETFDHVLCDHLLPYPNATLHVSDVVPYKAHFYWCKRQLLSTVVVGRFGRDFNVLIAQMRNEYGQPIGTLRSHRGAPFKAHDCHGEKTTLSVNRSSTRRDFTLFWNAPNSWNATLHNTSLLLTVGKPLNLWRLVYRVPEFTGDPVTNPGPESYEIVTLPF